MAKNVQNLDIATDPPQKQVLLLSCMDQRLLDNVVRFMDNLNLQNRYDHFILAGAAMGACHGASKGKCDGSHEVTLEWKQVFFDHLDTAVNKLHRTISDIFILEHLDCGAYKVLEGYPKREKYRKLLEEHNWAELAKLHKSEAQAFKKQIEAFRAEQQSKAEQDYQSRIANLKSPHDPEVVSLLEHERRVWNKLRVSCFVMDLTGEVREM